MKQLEKLYVNIKFIYHLKVNFKMWNMCSLIINKKILNINFSSEKIRIHLKNIEFNNRVIMEHKKAENMCEI